jgi:hypothetical protein
VRYRFSVSCRKRPFVEGRVTAVEAAVCDSRGGPSGDAFRFEKKRTKVSVQKFDALRDTTGGSRRSTATSSTSLRRCGPSNCILPRHIALSLHALAGAKDLSSQLKYRAAVGSSSITFLFFFEIPGVSPSPASWKLKVC